MVDSYDILVIILSVMLAVFLTLATISTVYLIKVVRDVRHMTKKAGSVVSNIEAVSKAASSSGPASFIANVISTMIEKSVKGEKDNNEGR